MGEHTKLPWRVPNKHDRRICDKRGYLIAKCLIETKGIGFKISVEEAEANASLIVKAVNAHEAMKAALQKIVFDWDGEPEDMADAKAALSLAEGVEP